MSTHFLATPLGKINLVIQNRSNILPRKDGRHHRPRRRQHLHIYRETQRGGAPRLLGGQGALQSTILEGIQKNQQGQVTRVQDFVMPSFTLKNKQAKVISNVSTLSSDLFSQLSSIMDQKIADIYKTVNDLLDSLKDQLDIMKKRKSVDDNCAFQIVSPSVTPASAREASYAMPMNYYKGQTPPPQASQPNMVGPVGPV